MFFLYITMSSSQPILEHFAFSCELLLRELWTMQTVVYWYALWWLGLLFYFQKSGEITSTRKHAYDHSKKSIFWKLGWVVMLALSLSTHSWYHLQIHIVRPIKASLWIHLLYQKRWLPQVILIICEALLHHPLPIVNIGCLVPPPSICGLHQPKLPSLNQRCH
jgi:hypothetical protein